MTKLPAGTETRLPVGALFKLEDDISAWVECVEGALWISQVAEPRDVVLAAGEGVALACPRHAIVGAINGAAVVRIAECVHLSEAA
jgi:Protein of unknown function (DUF2917)